MQSPPDYTFDADRLAALDRYDILNTQAEEGFDDIVQLATILCDVPVSLVSLVSHDRQWFKARVGFAPCETDLNSSVCSHALVEPDLLIIPDLTADARSCANPLVNEDPHIRFYAGAPLRTADGEVLGSLCVIDTKPRPEGLTSAQVIGFRSLAREVISQLELRKALKERDGHMRELSDAGERRRALLEIGDILRESKTIPEMTRAAAAVAGKGLQASRAGFARFDAQNDTV